MKTYRIPFTSSKFMLQSCDISFGRITIDCRRHFSSPGTFKIETWIFTGENTAKSYKYEVSEACGEINLIIGAFHYHIAFKHDHLTVTTRRNLRDVHDNVNGWSFSNDVKKFLVS